MVTVRVTGFAAARPGAIRAVDKARAAIRVFMSFGPIQKISST
jgi:hypothetical protein